MCSASFGSAKLPACQRQPGSSDKRPSMRVCLLAHMHARPQCAAGVINAIIVNSLFAKD